MKKLFNWVALSGLIIIVSGLGGLFLLWMYTTIRVESAKAQGIYPSPKEGMLALIQQGYQGIQKIDVDHAGTNSFNGSNPHIWFVTAKVWAVTRSDGTPLHAKGYDWPGSYFLRVENSWVYMPEGAFPEMIGFGMKIFKIYGCSAAYDPCT